MRFYYFVFLLMTALLGCKTPTPPQPESLYQIPQDNGDGWEVTSLTTAGMDSALIEKLLKKIESGDYPNLHALTVAKNGKLVLDLFLKKELSEYDHYAENTDLELHAAMSVTKSLVSLMVGIAIDQELFRGIDQEIKPMFPEYQSLNNPDPRKEKWTLRNFLTMRHGLEWDEESYDYDDSRNSYQLMANSADWVRFTLSRPMITDPGSDFAYSSGITQVISAAVQNISQEEFTAFTQEHLLTPLGINKTAWYYSNEGRAEDIFLTCRDMLKIGQLVLDKGLWKGKRIVSEKWIDRSTKKWVDLSDDYGYGFQWWIRNFQINQTSITSILAWGFGGQFILVFPDLKITVAITQGNYDSEELSIQVFDLLKNFILPQ